jgi:hypothetical protein
LQPEILSKRIKNNLLSQKKKLEEYLNVLENETEDLVKTDAEKLIKHIEIEKKIIADLSEFKQMLDPLEKMYLEMQDNGDLSITELRINIEKLTGHVKEKTLENKDKLETILNNVKAEFKEKSKDKFAQNTLHEVHSNLVDVNG